eukprot:NODE_967_length_1289_cov_2.731767.p3 GENE.NODE_967_length_1289_cov_2.731767~~NODE_967_length_1289_cov_2.731767.p3  ORF type:complete len:130 (-),score=13.79 NODE_967_length_1289_cov_2.731767:79-468(-)
MIDLSPSAGRLSTSTFDDAGNDIAPCILPRMHIWLHLEHERLMLGREALLFQGFPINRMLEKLSEMPERLSQDLAGNAVALPVSLALLMATIFSVSWKDTDEAVDYEPASSCEEVQDALALLGIVGNFT